MPALYVHIPYCIKKCPYCDFNSYGVGEERKVADEQAYTDALVAELRHFAPRLREPFGTVFFGGGTPSLFRPESIRRVLGEARTTVGIADNAEITLEANPGTIQEELGVERLTGFRETGVNRISMGAQSFAPAKLAALGRLHSGEEVERAVENIRRAGFERFNVDLIFAVESETLEQWETDLRRALALRPSHLSAYALTIEPGTEFARRKQAGSIVLATDDSQAALYERTQELTAEAGLEQYEISNYARTGFECRHNLAYWTNVEYLGIGAGAHSFHPRMEGDDCGDDYGERRSNIPGPAHYIERAKSSGDASQRRERLDRAAARTELFFLGLRTRDGIDLEDLERRFETPPTAALEAEVAMLVDRGLLTREGARVRLTRRGYLFADGIMGDLAAAAES